MVATGEHEERREAAVPEHRMRVSDEDRLRTVELLGEHAAAGRLTLGELEERIGRAYEATTRAELAALTADLPGTETPPPTRRVTRWLVAVMGGSRRTTRRRLAGRVNVVAFMGGDDIDLREAEIEGGELVINVFCCMGGTDIYLPDTVDVEVTGFAIFGANDERGSRRRPRPGAPLVRIRCFTLMGGVEVWRLPAETAGQSLKLARRAARELERGR